MLVEGSPRELERAPRPIGRSRRPTALSHADACLCGGVVVDMLLETRDEALKLVFRSPWWTCCRRRPVGGPTGEVLPRGGHGRVGLRGAESASSPSSSRTCIRPGFLGPIVEVRRRCGEHRRAGSQRLRQGTVYTVTSADEDLASGHPLPLAVALKSRFADPTGSLGLHKPLF